MNKNRKSSRGTSLDIERACVNSKESKLITKVKKAIVNALIDSKVDHPIPNKIPFLKDLVFKNFLIAKYFVSSETTIGPKANNIAGKI